MSASIRRWIGPGLAVLFLTSPIDAVAASRPSHPPPPRTPQSLPYIPGEVVVIANQGILDAATGGAAFSRNASVNGLLASLGLAKGRILGPSLRRGAPRREEAWVLTSRSPGFDPVAAASALQATGVVRAATANYRFSLFATLPSDLFLPFQWYVDDNGFADIRLPQAWDLARGDTSVVIAIMDTGVDTTHPDLASQIWRNAEEVAGNGIDDDGNGLIDDVGGWDFGMGDNDPKPEYTADASGIDVGFHGTFCAGIASAATDNGDGISGAGWKCRIMPLKISRPDSGLVSSAIAGAFLYAIDQHASVISMSFGGPGDPGVPEFFQELVDMATNAGVLCVAAAGNDGSDVPVYPAACGNVLAVGATGLDNARASFSNWGAWVDVAAPGSTMWSTICGNYEFTILDQLFYLLLFGWDGLNPYMYGDGTSFACPLTAGVCGLVRAKYPGLTPQTVMQHLIATGDAVAYDLPIGVKVNAFRAVSSLPTAVAVEPLAPAVARVVAVPNPISGAGEIRFDLPMGGWARLALFDAQGRRVRALAEGVFTPGVHRVLWNGADERGYHLAAAVYFARLETREHMTTTKLILVP